MRIFQMATVLTMMLGASGCQTTYYDAGNGPITLSPSAARAYARYLEYQYPLAFAISEDGRTYHIYHCTGFNCNPGDAMAVSRCNERASKRGQVCKTFAIERDIVWKGQVRGLKGAVSANFTSLPDANKYVSCALPGQGGAVWHKKSDCMRYGGKISEEKTTVYGSPKTALPPGVYSVSGLSSPELCARALDPDKEGAWGTKAEFTSFVAEAKRRNIDAGKCEELISGKTTADKDDNTYIVCLLPSGLHNYISTKSCRQRGGKEAS